ncbi:hypothetical protein [Nonomuraea dietziae]|uniref:hypothetical protein n=1 Tax=Nonomuraea dietziae TaxID=65515 RepID=UPI0034304D7A
MVSDGGLEVSRKAIRNARTDLDELLDLFVPGVTSYDDVNPVAFPDKGAVRALAADHGAMGGFWAASIGMRTSFTQAEAAVGGSYESISRTLAATVQLLSAALTNLDTGEQKSAEHAGTAKV